VTRPTPASERGSRRHAALVACAGLAGLAVWVGCTVTADNYEFYRFFFDGVPDPTAIVLPGDRLASESPTYSLHQPFAEDKCVECHGRRFSPQGVSSSVCLSCHEGVTTAQPRMHGPVVTVACLWCHAPHESPYAALFKGPPREVCANCHSPGLLGTTKTPEHLPDSAVSCLECHFGHGGVSRHFLRQAGHGLGEPGTTPGDAIDELSNGDGIRLPIEEEPQP
jgi:predicted CXXCH cytochrome family protein